MENAAKGSGNSYSTTGSGECHLVPRLRSAVAAGGQGIFVT